MKAPHGPVDGRTPADPANGTGAASAYARGALNAAERAAIPALGHDQAIHEPAFATDVKYPGERYRVSWLAGVASGA